MSDTNTQSIETTPIAKADLIYRIEDKPSFKDSFFAAIQHLLAIFVGIITPPLIIADALGCDVTTKAFLVSMSLFASGISTFIQCRRVGPLGAGLLCVQGTSFSFIGPIISAGLVGGLPLIFGCTIAAAPVEMIVSRTFRYLKKVITPLVSGIVVLLIGLSLVKVGIFSCGGGQTAMQTGTFGTAENILIAAVVLVSVLLFNKSGNKYLRMSSIVLGLILGYLLALVMGHVSFASFGQSSQALFNIPTPFKYGLDFNISSFIAMALIYMITAIEATGDITANSLISGEDIEGEKYLKRVSGGVMADGFNSLLAGIFNSFPNSIFAQNNGIIQLTGVASRRVGYYIAAMLLILGIFPGIGLVFSLMPDPVLGGATLLMFGTVAAAGIRIIASQDIDRKATMVLAISLSLGLGVELMPDILKAAPESIRAIFSSGITTGGIAAIISNIVVRK
ncbi:nucleobase:cation symporter-2 family protein [Porphyromonas pogonae]|uniref:nucleobase:cation symporter-2 family protein n=1 Tax=Porphyromonas pogonae TaxID=867595 RepID=UPI002E777BDC|nr:nucleobase:cation symporter-2 family protein [Porphyromonas pogonae]